ncbi:MAG: Hpt domain-containing protein [Bacteroidales bacterium]|jgi:HPt (histidine-containing phosphotransfer) domain-containing protein|nr:Hpt domain-containing protein [Bacteroidales bacterium]
MDYKFINTEYLDSVSGGDNEIIREIVVMFGEQVVETANQMKTLLAERNYTTLGLLAHKAKSSVAIMGMSDLAALLKTFELQAKEEIETELYESYINRFVFETGEAMKELNELVNNRLKKI